MPYDLVIRGGMVIDGTGIAPYRADVGVVGDRIATIGDIDEVGAAEIDATGRFVTPGFIDGHTHLDAQIFWDPYGNPASLHGVTTVIMGNCGFTLAPCREAEQDYVFRALERAEDMSRDALLAGVKWSWEHYAEYLDTVERLPKGINYAGYVGHSALRTYVMGDRAFDEIASDDDIAAMQAELEAALRAGAFGFSTTRSAAHRMTDERPVPSRIADWSEVVALVEVEHRLGAGIFQLDNEKHEPGPDRVEYLDRLRRLVVSTGRPTFFMLVVPPAEPDFGKERLAVAEAVAASGGHLHPQVHTQEQFIIRSFRTKLPFDKLQRWSEFRKLSLEEQKKALLDPEQRAALVDEALHGNYSDTVQQALRPETNAPVTQAKVGALTFAESRPPDFNLIFVLDQAEPPYRTVQAVADEQGVTPADLMIDLALATNFDQMFGQVVMNRDMDTVESMLRHPTTVVGTSDTGAHVSVSSNSSIPTHLLSYWVRGRKAFSWEEGVRMLTSVPAGVYGFAERGELKVGYFADLVVFDPDTVGFNLPTLEHDFPASTARLKQTSNGIDATVVAGQVLLRNGEYTGALPGRLIRGPLAQTPVTSQS